MYKPYRAEQENFPIFHHFDLSYSLSQPHRNNIYIRTPTSMAEPSTDPLASVSPPKSPSLSIIEAVELPKKDRIDLAVEAFKKTKDKTSLNKIARQHRIWPSTLHRRVAKDAISAKEFNQSRQRLSPKEETALEKYICRLQA